MALPYEFEAKTIFEEGRVTRSAVEEVQEWLRKSELPRLQEEMIVLFLLSCENDVAAAEKTILAFFKCKSEMPEFFTERDIDNEDLTSAMKMITCCSLPARFNNTVVHFFKLIDTNYRHVNLVLGMKLAFMLINISQRYNPPSEVIILADMEGCGLMHLTCIRMGALKKFFEFLQEAMPLKIQSIHILNANFMFDRFLSIAKLFMKSELLSLVIGHPPKMNLEEFHEKWIPASCLPKEYGGELSSMEELNQTTIRQLRELKEFFLAEEELVSSVQKITVS